TPEIQFFEGNMLSLEVADDSCGAIAAFYSIIHLTPEELPKVFLEFKRVLRPRGTLLLAFHVGKENVHEDELWGYKVSLDLRFLESREIEQQLHATGFRVRETIERETYGEDVEYPSRRAYIFAEKPQLRG
ncbi:MAG: class I SAM-dependent methyltransferase, partial [Acidobacteria bacterium]